MKQISVLHIDQQSVFLNGVKICLAKQNNFQHIDLEEKSYEGLKLKIIRYQPDIILIDYSLEGFNILKFISDLDRINSTLKAMIIASEQNFDSLNHRLINESNLGIMSREIKFEDIKNAISGLYYNGHYRCNSYEEYVSRIKSDSSNEKNTFDKFKKYSLTFREHEILEHISGGASTKEIANILCLSNRTIDAHRLKISKKLSLSGKNALMKFAIESKLQFSLK